MAKKTQSLLDINPFLQSLVKKIVGEIRVTGAMVETDYKREVPVDTGRLRSSIHMQHSDNQGHTYSDNQGRMFDGTLPTKADRYTVFVGTNVEYATRIELGQTKTQKGKKALENAFEKNTRGLIGRLEKLIK
jgi:carbon monoxide dehydrogenase subunit G